MYEKFANWKNFPDESTPITAAALSHIEQGITDVDVTRPGTPAEVELAARVSAAAGSAEGLVQAERAAREAAVTAEQSARVAAIEAETAARKTAIIGESDARIAALALKADAVAVYTKAQVDAAVSTKADSAAVYTKGAADALLNAKANTVDVYTKTAADARFAPLVATDVPVLSGIGSPNGVVTAPGGTLYSDISAANGASLWTKFNATGNMGWRVVTGRTGRRDISSLLAVSPDFTPERAQIERTAEMLIIRLIITVRVETRVTLMANSVLPRDWAPIAYETFPMQLPAGGTRQLVVGSAGEMYVEAGPVMGKLFTTVTCPSRPEYPASLPGTAV